MVEVKICGIRDDEAMRAALNSGADLVGLVFFPPSPRSITPGEAAKLVQFARGHAAIVALVVDASDDVLTKIVNEVAPDLIQLHGSETPERVATIRAKYGRPVMKAIPVATGSDLDIVPAFAAVADRILFDAKAPHDATRPGGHGRVFDWSLLANAGRTRPIMLSGGLNSDNVPEAIRITRPDAVDVSSGVEAAPGQKDPAKIAAFVQAARTAAAALKPEKVS